MAVNRPRQRLYLSCQKCGAVSLRRFKVPRRRRVTGFHCRACGAWHRRRRWKESRALDVILRGGPVV